MVRRAHYLCHRRDGRGNGGMAEQDYTFAELYPVDELPDRLPQRTGAPRLKLSTVYAWLNLGGGAPRTLRSVKVGRTRFTCDRWVQDFTEAGRGRGQLTPAKIAREKQRAKELCADI
jgi:hypothetical protein